MVVINFTVWKLASVRYVKSEKKKKEDKRSTWLWREGEVDVVVVGLEGCVVFVVIVVDCGCVVVILALEGRVVFGGVIVVVVWLP